MYINLETLEYPVSAQQIQAAHPHVSFPVPFSPCDGYALVQPADQPAHDPDTHGAEEGEPSEEAGVWVQRWRVTPLTPAEIAERLAAEKAALMAASTARRWEVETGGVAFPDGTRVGTTTEDQNRITTVIANAALAGVSAVDFKAATGWVSLTLAELQGMAAVIALHVQACFSAERAHHEAIGALSSLAAVREYDLSAGWPSSAAFRGNARA